LNFVDIEAKCAKTWKYERLLVVCARQKIQSRPFESKGEKKSKKKLAADMEKSII
jgi:hypothetical protein